MRRKKEEKKKERKEERGKEKRKRRRKKDKKKRRGNKRQEKKKKNKFFSLHSIISIRRYISGIVLIVPKSNFIQRGRKFFEHRMLIFSISTFELREYTLITIAKL